uniref:Uncharacterized protein n=1 Tax=Rhizophora mucronata TaxID=61149 RepID=A0A2P2NEY3_RHIMU
MKPCRTNDKKNRTFSKIHYTFGIHQLENFCLLSLA